MRLELNECSYLRKRLGTTSPVSLFSSIEAPENGDEEQTLTEKGILRDGQLASDILSVVANAEKASRLVLNDGYFIVEKYTFKEDDQLTLAINDAGTLVFEKVEKRNSLSKDMAEFYGLSVIKNTDVDLSLKTDELMLFLAMVDNLREKALLELLEINEETFIPLQVSLDKNVLISSMNNPKSSSVTDILKRHYELESLDEKRFEAALRGLINKEIIAASNPFELDGEYYKFATSFLVPELTLLLEQYEIAQTGDLAVTSGFVLSTGMRSHLAFIFTEDEVEVFTLSSLQILQLIENFLMLE